MKKIFSNNSIFAILLFISVYSIHAVCVYLWGVNVPFWDQWDAEVKLYIAFVTNSIDLEALINAHNEHRIAITRLWSLLVFSLRGGWDPVFAMYAQALIQSVNAVFLFIIVNPNRTSIVYKFSSMIAIVAVFGFPYYEENILWSFQNQFYWMQFFGLTSFYLYTKRDTKLKFIGIGLLNFCSIFTVASGLLSILVSSSLSFYFIFIKKDYRKRWTILFSFQFLLLILSRLLWVNVSEHGVLKARDLNDLINSYVNILSWPNGIINLILYFSFIYYFFIYQKMAERIYCGFLIFFTKNQIILFALLGWVLLQILAVAYGRANGDVLSSRYLITYAILFPILLYFTRTSFKSVFTLLIALLISFSLARYSIQIALPVIVKNNYDRTRWKASLKDAYLNNDMSILVKTKNKLHPRPKRIWKGLNNKDLKPYHLWMKNWQIESKRE